MRYIKLLPTVILAMGVLSCGGEGPLGGPEDALARVGEQYVTEDDFRTVFSGLSPEEQVAVLDPGGRISLVDRIVNKRLLEMATDSLDLPGLEWWRTLYSRTDLSQQYSATMAQSAREEAADTTGWPEENWFVMDIVLVRDSSAAAEVAESWESEGPTEPDSSLMALAPWSRGESSFRTLQNYVVLMPVYLREAVMAHIDEGVAVAPMFGAYAVFRITTTEAEEPMRMENAVPAMLANRLYSEAGLKPRSRAIERFATGLGQSGGRYVPEERRWDPEDTLLSYRNGAITAGEAAEMFGRLRMNNFLSQPSELARIMPPRPSEGNRGVEVWMYLTSLARLEWQAGRAEQEGMEPDPDLVRMAEVEHLLRSRVIDSLSAVDTSTLEGFYNENIQRYTIPERRVVLRADIPASDTAGISQMGRLRQLEARGDSVIRLSVSPPLDRGAFGPIGEEVFEADTFGVHGPVVQADTLPLVYFEVMAVLPDSVLEFSRITDRIRNDYVMQYAESRLEEIIMELRDAYDVEIDSTAVERVDPW